jgi:hypothetical protein
VDRNEKGCEIVDTKQPGKVQILAGDTWERGIEPSGLHTALGLLRRHGDGQLRLHSNCTHTHTHTLSYTAAPITTAMKTIHIQINIHHNYNYNIYNYLNLLKHFRVITN